MSFLEDFKSTMKKELVSIGFTGTEQGMTELQKVSLSNYLKEYKGDFHHGDCIGADEEAHQIAMELGYKIVIHPPINSKKRAFCREGNILPKKEYLIRNRDIVYSSDILIATPKERNEIMRSGVWSTIRFARMIGNKVKIIYPEIK